MTRPLPFPIAAAALPRETGVLDFLRLLWAIDHALQQRSKRMMRLFGLTGVQRFVLRAVGQYPSITPGQLAGILHLHPSTVTGVIQRLQQRGFVVRRLDRTDRRRSLLALTPRGRAIDRRRGGTIEMEIEKALDRLRPGDVETTRRALTTVAEQLAGVPDPS